MWITLDNGYDILQEIKSENPTTLRKPTEEEGKNPPGFSKNVGIWNDDNNRNTNIENLIETNVTRFLTPKKLYI